MDQKKTSEPPKISPYTPGVATPDFGTGTPTFGSEERLAFIREFGPGNLTSEVSSLSDWKYSEFPRWPTWEPDEDAGEEKIFPVRSGEPDRPVKATDLPHMAQLFTDHRGNFSVKIMWPDEVLFKSGQKRKTFWFSASQYGSREDTKDAAFSYFRDLRSLARGGTPKSGKGPLREEPEADGLLYHGGRNHTFVCWKSMKDFGKDSDVKVIIWNPHTETLEAPDDFCVCNDHAGAVAPGVHRYRCMGHLHAEDGSTRLPSESVAGKGPSGIGRLVRGENPFEADRDAEDAAAGAGLPHWVPTRYPQKGALTETDLFNAKRPIFLELGSGTGRLSGEIDSREILAIPVDRPGGVFRDEVPTLHLDMTTEHAQELLQDAVRTGRVVHVHMSAPGTSFDKIKDGRHRMRDKARPPLRALRDETHLLGKPRRDAEHPEGLTEAESRKVDHDNSVVHLYKTIIDLCENQGASWTVEARADSWMWNLGFMIDHESLEGVERVEFHGCAFGGPQPVRLAIVGRLPGLTKRLLRRCEAGHRHRAVPPGAELAYPAELVQQFAELIRQALVNRGAVKGEPGPSGQDVGDPEDLFGGPDDEGARPRSPSGVDEHELDDPRGSDAEVDEQAGGQPEPWFQPAGMDGWWAVTHRTARRKLYVPQATAHPGDGPEIRRLSRRRWTYLRRCEPATANQVEEYEVSDHSEATEMAYWWTGTTYFKEVVEGDEDPLDIGHEWQPEIVKGMIRGVGNPGAPMLAKDLSVIGIERGLLVDKQMACPFFGPIYAACEAADRGENPYKALKEYEREHPEHLAKRKVDSLVKTSDRFELVDGVLMRRVYDPLDREVQLRIVAPEGGMASFYPPGQRKKESLGIRERILLEYHSGKMGGHLGAEKTVLRIEKDWYWPGLYTDVDAWCAHCDLCRGEKGHAALSAWSRTELYSRPFRVIQFDTVECAPADAELQPDHEMKYILTAICCFSRWVWLVPIPDKTAETIGRALLERVLLDLAMFPAVLRSDRAPEFTGSVVAYINHQLEIKHVLGASYHPQSQGIVERMHRTLKMIGKALAEGNPGDWPAMVPYAQCILRILPLKSLGNRSPYEVVTGLRPKLPSTLLARFPVQEVDVDTYAAQLIDYLKVTYHRIKALMQDAADMAEQNAPGSMMRELEVGDLVLRRLNPKQIQKLAGTGPYRFTRTVDPRIYRVAKKIADQGFAYRLCDHHNPSMAVDFKQPVSRRMLIKLDMPDMELEAVQERRRLEIYIDDENCWYRATLEAIALDGRARIRWDDSPGKLEDVDITEHRYRWILGENVRGWDARDGLEGRSD